MRTEEIYRNQAAGIKWSFERQGWLCTRTGQELTRAEAKRRYDEVDYGEDE